MSGLDEIGKRGIPQCPNCGHITKYWLVRDKREDILCYLNYEEELAKVNGEFNFKVGTEDFFKRAYYIQCNICRYLDFDELFMEAIWAIKNDFRRFLHFVGNR